MSNHIADRDPQVVAVEADQLLNNPLLKAALNEIEEDIVAQMKAAPMIGNPLANEYRDKLILSLQALELVKAQIHGYVITGQLTALQPPQEI